MANYYNFSSSNINIFIILMDKSNSMEKDANNVRKCSKGFIKSFNNLKWTDFFVIVPLAISGLFFIIMSLKLKRKVLNNFAIKKK